VDKELTEQLKKIKSNNNSKEIFPEHQFISSCLRIGLTISDLRELTYVDVMKILFTFIDSNVIQKEATQSDIDKLLG